MAAAAAIGRPAGLSSSGNFGADGLLITPLPSPDRHSDGLYASPDPSMGTASYQSGYYEDGSWPVAGSPAGSWASPAPSHAGPGAPSASPATASSAPVIKVGAASRMRAPVRDLRFQPKRASSSTAAAMAVRHAAGMGDRNVDAVADFGGTDAGGLDGAAEGHGAGDIDGKHEVEDGDDDADGSGGDGSDYMSAKNRNARRRQQIREASRRFRDRKRTEMSSLEETVVKLQQQVNALRAAATSAGLVAPDSVVGTASRNGKRASSALGDSGDDEEANGPHGGVDGESVFSSRNSVRESESGTGREGSHSPSRSSSRGHGGKSDPMEKRREQVREASRRFRERKRAEVNGLEDTCNKLQQELKVLQAVPGISKVAAAVAASNLRSSSASAGAARRVSAASSVAIPAASTTSLSGAAADAGSLPSASAAVVDAASRSDLFPAGISIMSASPSAYRAAVNHIHSLSTSSSSSGSGIDGGGSSSPAPARPAVQGGRSAHVTHVASQQPHQNKQRQRAAAQPGSGRLPDGRRVRIRLAGHTFTALNIATVSAVEEQDVAAGYEYSSNGAANQSKAIVWPSQWHPRSAVGASSAASGGAAMHPATLHESAPRAMPRPAPSGLIASHLHPSSAATAASSAARPGAAHAGTAATSPPSAGAPTQASTSSIHNGASSIGGKHNPETMAFDLAAEVLLDVAGHGPLSRTSSPAVTPSHSSQVQGKVQKQLQQQQQQQQVYSNTGYQQQQQQQHDDGSASYPKHMHDSTVTATDLLEYQAGHDNESTAASAAAIDGAYQEGGTSEQQQQHYGYQHQHHPPQQYQQYQQYHRVLGSDWRGGPLPNASTSGRAGPAMMDNGMVMMVDGRAASYGGPAGHAGYAYPGGAHVVGYPMQQGPGSGAGGVGPGNGWAHGPAATANFHHGPGYHGQGYGTGQGVGAAAVAPPVSRPGILRRAPPYAPTTLSSANRAMPSPIPHPHIRTALLTPSMPFAVSPVADGAQRPVAPFRGFASGAAAGIATAATPTAAAAHARVMPGTNQAHQPASLTFPRAAAPETPHSATHSSSPTAIAPAPARRPPPVLAHGGHGHAPAPAVPSY